MNNVMEDCCAHGAKCFVPAVDLLIVGTSCKDLSKANPNKYKHQQAVLSQSSSRGGSAQTFRSLLAYLDAHRPALIIYENVDAVEDSSPSGNSNFTVLMEEFERRGYVGQPTICEASKFGPPCRRRRLYVFLVQTTANAVVDLSSRPLTSCFAEFRQFLASCMREGPSLEEVLLSHDDDAVMSELRRKGREHETMAKMVTAEWPEAHMKFAADIRKLWGQPAGAHLQQNPWYHTLGLREKNALPLLQFQTPAATGMVRDLSQSIQRANSITWQEDTKRHVCPTLLSKQSLWVENLPNSRHGARLMLGREALLLQGFPICALLSEMARLGDRPQAGSLERPQAGTQQRPQAGTQQRPQAGSLQRPQAGRMAHEVKPRETFPEEDLMADLAGNGMSLAVLLAVLQSGLSCLRWKKTEWSAPVSAESDIEKACAAVETLRSASDASNAGTAGPAVETSEGFLKKRRRG
jgi:site-specific DNA-cytosine methylase